MAMPQTKRKPPSMPSKGQAKPSPWPLIRAIACCVILLAAALLPYDRFATGASQDFASIPQMADDPPVASARDVIRAYHLVDSAEPYLRVEENQIYFDGQVAQGGR